MLDKDGIPLIFFAIIKLIESLLGGIDKIFYWADGGKVLIEIPMGLQIQMVRLLDYGNSCIVIYTFVSLNDLNRAKQVVPHSLRQRIVPILYSEHAFTFVNAKSMEFLVEIRLVNVRAPSEIDFIELYQCSVGDTAGSIQIIELLN
jgi:hypothetical protein